MTNTTDITADIRHDLFAAIKFEKRQGGNGTTRGLQLGPHFVFDWLVKDAWAHFAAGIPPANVVKFYSSEDLFNDAERWAALDKPFHIAIGRCLAFFVREGMLPLFCVNPDANNKLYMVLNH